MAVSDIIKKYNPQSTASNSSVSDILRKYRQQPKNIETEKDKGGLLGGIEYVGANLGAGVVGVGEGMWDFVAGGIADLFGADEYAEYLHKNDIAGGIAQRAAEKFNPSKGWQFAGDVASGIGQTGVGIAVAAAATVLSAGVLAPFAGTIAAGTIGLGAAGRATTQAYQQTGELGGKEYLYGAISGGVEGALEAFTGAAGKIAKRTLSKTTTTLAKTAIRKGILKNMISEGAGEFIEEALSTAIDPILQKTTGVDKNAKMASFDEIFYNGLVGFVAGGLSSGAGSAVSSVSNLRRGAKLQTEGKSDKIISEANTLVSTLQGDISEAAQPMKSLAASLNSYNTIENKSSVRGKMLLGEIQKNVAFIEISEGVQSSFENVVNNADQISQFMNLNAEDIKSNKDGIAMGLAVSDFAGQLISEPSATVNESSFRQWRENLTTEQKERINKETGIDINNASYYEASRALKEYKPDGIATSTESDVNAAIRTFNGIKSDVLEVTPRGEARPQYPNLPQTINLDEGETQVYRAKNGNVIGIQRTQDGYIVAASNASGEGLGRSARVISAEELPTVLTAIQKQDFKKPAKKVETQKEIKTEVKTEAKTEIKTENQTTARKYVKNFDLLSRTKKARILEAIETGERYGIDEKTLNAVANIVAIRDLGISFSDTVTENGLYATINGNRLAVINPKTDVIRESILHEITHDIEGTKEYEALSSVALKMTPQEEQEATRKQYKERFKDISEETLQNEITADFLARKLDERNFLDKFVNEQQGILMMIKRRLINFVNKFKGNAVIEKTEKEIEKVYNQALKAINTKTTEQPKFSLAETAGAIESQTAEAKRLWEEQGTDSPYFKKWFGDSKIVDRKGEPLIVYHGTSSINKINKFDPTKSHYSGMFFFSEHPLFALEWAAGVYDDFTKTKWDEDGNYYIEDIDVSNFEEKILGINGKINLKVKGLGVTVYPAYLKVERIFDNLNKNETPSLIEHLKNTNKYSEYEIEGIIEDLTDDYHFESREIAEVVQWIKKQGYDGMKITEDQNKTTNYAVFSPEQIKSATGNIGTFSPDTADIRYSLANDRVLVNKPTPIKQNTKQLARDAFTNLKIAFVDEYAGIESIGKRLGVNLESDIQMIRSANAQAQNMLTTDQYDLITGEKVGKGLGAIMSPINKKGDTYKGQFFDYLIHKHNIDRIAQNKNIFPDVTLEDSKKAVEQYEQSNPEFKEYSEELKTYNETLLKYRVDTGLINQELSGKLKEIYPYYVPTYRSKDLMQGGNEIRNLRVSQTIQKAQGESDMAVNPIDDSISEQTMRTIRAGHINQIMNKIKDSADVEIISKEKLDVDTAEELYEPTPKKNQVTFYSNGERITARVSAQVFSGLDNSMPAVLTENIVVKAMSKINTGFKRLVTSLNPAFLVRNALRDIQDAGIYTKYGVGKLAKNYGRAISEIKNNGKYWKLYRAMGGIHSSIYNFDTGVMKEVTPKGFTKSESNFLSKGLTAIENANLFVEQLPRLAEFITSIEAGASKEQALLNSADVTTNFGRTGKITRILNRTLIPFLNPSIQGFSKLIRTITTAKASKAFTQLAIKAAILGLIPQLLNQLMYDDDEDYKNLRDTDKENNYLFKVGDNFIKLPKGRVTSVLAGLMNRTQQSIKGDKDSWEGYLDNVLQQVTPVDSLSRTVFSPFADVKNNVTWYGGAIEGREFESIEPKKRYDERTSSIAIKLGSWLNYSPKKIHYLLDQYSGVIGDFILPATTAQAEKGFLQGNFTLDPVRSNKLSTEFYKLYDETTYKKDDPTAALQLRYLNKVKSAISKLYDQKVYAENGDTSDTEKRKETKVVQALINETYKTALQDFELMTNAIEATEGVQDSLRFTEATRLMYGSERALRDYNKDVYSKAQALNKAKIGYDLYYNYYFGTKDITEKDKVVSYINSLKVSDTQKLILIYSKGYVVQSGDFKTYTKDSARLTVQNYILGLNISVAEKQEIAERLGFKYVNGILKVT